MSTVFNSDSTILVAVVPFSNGVGLVSYHFDNVSMVYREKAFLPRSNQNCMPAFFPPFPNLPVLGYCLDLMNHRIENLFVIVNFDRLNSSYVMVATQFFRFTFQSGTVLSNFLYFSEESMNSCFLVEDGRTIFLSNSNIIDHQLSIMEYESDIGNINLPACSRLQSLIDDTECKLAAYCNGMAALFNFPDSFSGVTPFSGDVFFCSPSVYVRFLNNSLSVCSVGVSDEQVSGSLSLDAEAIVLGDCLTSEDQFYFVASLSDARTIFVNFTNLSISIVGENANPMLLPYTVMDQLLYVNNDTHSLIYNWTRMCREDVLVVPRNFDLVHSFIIDQGLSAECGCTTQDTVTTPAPIDNTTTTNQMEPTTFTMSITDTTSRTTIEQPTNPLQQETGLSTGAEAGIIIAVTVIAVVVLVLLIIAAVIVCRK